MFFRRIDKDNVKTAIAYGEIIESYPQDTPFPSYLMLDFVKGRPIHVVFSYDVDTQTGYVVTTYIPTPDL
jgi:hypothetical protein